MIANENYGNLVCSALNLLQKKFQTLLIAAQFLVVLKYICNNKHTVGYNSKSKMLTLAEQCKGIPHIHL